MNCFASEIKNLNFQLPLRAREPVKLDYLEFSPETNSIIGYFHLVRDFSSLKSTGDFSPQPIIFATFQQQPQTVQTLGSATEKQVNISQEKEEKFPLEVKISPETNEGLLKAVHYNSGNLAFKPNRYRFELKPFGNRYSILDKRMEIDLVVRLSASGLEASDNNNFDFPYKFKLVVVQHATAEADSHNQGIVQVEGINFVNGFFYSQENVRLLSLSHLDVKDGRPERIEGTIAVRNLCFEKKVYLHIEIGQSSAILKQQIEAFWFTSYNEQVDMFRFSYEFVSWDSGFERHFCIKKIEYFPSNLAKSIDNNNNEDIGYKMILNASCPVFPNGLETFLTNNLPTQKDSQQEEKFKRINPKGLSSLNEVKESLAKLKLDWNFKGEKEQDSEEENLNEKQPELNSPGKAQLKSCLKKQRTASENNILIPQKKQQLNLNRVTFCDEVDVNEISV